MAEDGWQDITYFPVIFLRLFKFLMQQDLSDTGFMFSLDDDDYLID